MNEIIRAGYTDVEVLSQVISDAFFDLPQSRWLIPDPDARRDIFPGYFQILVEHALSCGTVLTTPGRDAAALWIYVEHEPPTPADYLRRLKDATGTRADRFAVFDATLEQHHPIGEPHHHLAILAVHPDQQCQGTGASLLTAHHQQLDQTTRLPAYLEAAKRRSSRLYRRHCYATRPEGPFHLPGNGPAMWPMTRSSGSPPTPARIGLIVE